jgi:hypothetical protein
VVFVLLAAQGVLPAMFARPAGYGDILIGLTAPFVAWKLSNPGHRGSFILWQALGILDLVRRWAWGLWSDSFVREVCRWRR